MSTVTAKDIDVAAGVLAKVATKTPLQKSERLSEEVGRPVYLKREDLQICRSFKVRGAYVRMAAMDED
ncbi:MAG: pyridoxal-phosphate dependent enzyme, partial [Varibaculum cambriense]|nr:pyridoxal-phosphate dependent enzyme [Varibaculum cambriense]